MIVLMPTTELRLRKGADGYWRTDWVDDHRQRHGKSFGRARRAAEARFGRFRMAWARDPAVRNPGDEGPLTIRGAVAIWDEHAREYYRHRDGTPTGEARNVAEACAPLIDLFAGLPAREFSPRKLKRVRERMVGGKLCRNVINARVRRLRQVFKWLASEELVPIDVWHGLQTVGALRSGRSGARETEPVQPVPEAWVWATCERLPGTVEAMVRLQWLTGMRPGEVCRLRPIDLDTTGRIWLYRPVTHKTAWRGRRRVILLGPRAQAILRPFLQRTITAPCFSPIEAVRQRHAERELHRRQAVETPATARRVGSSYKPQAFGRAIAKACRRAEPGCAACEAAGRACEEHTIPHWSPNQLRHSAATRMRKEFGLEATRAALGHAHTDTTELYAEVDLERAKAIVERMG